MKIRVKPGLEIGDGCPTFVIAEVGSNWKSFEDCKNSIRQAKLAGADAVKFQLFTQPALYGYGLASIWGNTPFLDPAWLPKLKQIADESGIEFMCSAFSPELVDAVDPYVNLHKVASAELTHVRMLERLRDIGKPVILSTGASGEEDIRQALGVLEEGEVHTVLLYCVAAYPAREVDLGRIGLLRDRFGTLVGYSDHTTDVLVIPREAARAGATVLEKHVNFTEHRDTPDSPHSLTGGEFARMVQSIRGEYQSRSIGPSPGEENMLVQHNRRLLATRDIDVGEVLQEGVNFGIYRSLKEDTKALSPWVIDRVNGKRAKCKIEAGEGIGMEAV